MFFRRKIKVGDYTESNIAEIVQAFAQAAYEAKWLGFDGIELHGAHGYLIDQGYRPGGPSKIKKSLAKKYDVSIIDTSYFDISIVLLSSTT